MDKERLKQIILDNQEFIWNRKYIPRDKILPYKDLDRLEKIVAILGPRRAGKTYFLKQIIDELELKKEQIVFFDFSEISVEEYKPADFEQTLTAYYELSPDYKPYFFFDEIQEVGGFERGIKFLLNKGFKIFITGSSSKMMVQDLSSILRGKVMNFYLYPLNFSEYLNFKGADPIIMGNLTTKEKAIKTNLLLDFLKWGGFPEVVLSENDETKSNLLSSYIEVMLFRDIVERYSVKNIHIIDKLFWNLVRSFTKEISINKWFNDFKSQGLKVSKDTLHLYLKYFEDSFFVYFLNNRNKGNTGLKKVYLVDSGIYNQVKSFPPDKGKSFENLVFLDLMREGNSSLCFYRTSQGEVDFIFEDGVRQVCYSLTEENIGRELSGLALGLGISSKDSGEIIVLDDTELSSSNDSAISYLNWVSQLTQ